jgi:hypothetical protein
VYRTKAKYCQGLQSISHHDLQHIIIIIISIIILHVLGLDIPVSASFYSLFKDLPRRVRPCVLQFNIIFGILLLFIFVTCRSQSDVYLLSFWSAGSAFKSSNIFPISVVKTGAPGCPSEKFHLEWCQTFCNFFFLWVQMSLSYKGKGEPVNYTLLFFKISGPRMVWKYCLEFQVLEKMLLVLVEYCFHLQWKYHNRDIKISFSCKHSWPTTILHLIIVLNWHSLGFVWWYFHSKTFSMLCNVL